MIPLFVLNSIFQHVDEATFREDDSLVNEAALEASIAIVAGWTDVRFSEWREEWQGVNPNTGDRYPIPTFLTSLDAACTVIPNFWVESYYRTFSNTAVAKLYPRGDLGKSAIAYESSHPARAIVMCAIAAHIQMRSPAVIQTIPQRFRYAFTSDNGTTH